MSDKKDNSPQLSRRDFFKLWPAGASLFVGGLAEAWSASEFSYKREKLESLIDRNPSDLLLKEAYYAFIQSHIAIVGGRSKGLQLSSDNLEHYLYGNGDSVNITAKYRKIATDTGDTFEDYLSAAISNGINLRRNIKDPNMNNEELQKSVGYNLRHEQFPDLSSLKEIIWPQFNADLYYGLGRHTLKATLLTSDPINISSTEAIREVDNIVNALELNPNKIKIKRVEVVPVGPVIIKDWYHFNGPSEKPREGGSGTSGYSVVVGNVFSALDGLPISNNMPFYMGETNYNALLTGNIVLSSNGLSVLNELGICNNFYITASFKDVGKFPIDIITTGNT